MAVEKMYLVNIISRLDNLTELLKDVINIGQIEPIDAFNQVESRAFSVKASSENVELTEDMNSITSFEGLSKDDLEKINYLKNFLDLNNDDFGRNLKNLNILDKKDLEKFYEKIQPMIEKHKELKNKKETLMIYKENLEILDKAKIDIDKIKNLNYFDFRYGEVTKDGRFILKNNYDNIPSLIIHLDKDGLENIGALDDLIDLDKKTSIRRAEVDDIIDNERKESLILAEKIDKTYNDKIVDKVIELNKQYDANINNESIKIKEDYSKLKLKISDIYNEKVDSLIDQALEKITGGDINGK